MKVLSKLDSLDNVQDGDTRKLITKTTSSGNGNAVTAVSVSGDTITYTKGTSFLTSHQSAFSNVKVGSSTVAADQAGDTLELVAGSNITLTPDTTNDKVTIAATQPTVNNGTLTIQKNGTNVQTFTANQSSNTTANITVPTKTSDLTNDSNFITNTGNTSGNAGSATKLETARTIGIGTGATGTATSFNGTSNITIPITDIKEAYTTWGGKNISGDITAMDMGCVDEFGHNKLAFLPAGCIKVEYTNDGGTTWLDYGLTDAQKIAAVTTSGTNITIGKGTVKANDGTLTTANMGNYKVRVTISTRNGTGQTYGALYTQAKKLLINMTNNGATCKCLIENRTIANYNNNSDTWTTHGTFDISGWSGWNSIPYNIRFGGSSTQTSQIADLRITMYLTGINTAYACNAALIDFRLIGSTNWSMPSELARAGHLYKLDTDKRAIFPYDIRPETNNVGTLGTSSYKWNNVYATTFTGDLAGTASKATGDKNGNDITTTYQPTLVSGTNIKTINNTSLLGSGNITIGGGGTGTVTGVTAGAGLNTTSSDTATDGGTISSSGTLYLTKSGVTAGTYQGITVDKYGRVTSASNQGYVTTDTKNTAGSTDSSSKLFLVGATSQAANPQTYSQDTAYVGTDGHLYSNSKQTVNLSDSQALTNKTYNGYTLGAACAKAVVTSVDTSASLPTSNAVKTFVEGKGYTTNTGTITGVSINSTSIATSGVANIVTNSTYNSSSNKIATMSDVPSFTFTDITLNP